MLQLREELAALQESAKYDAERAELSEARSSATLEINESHSTNDKSTHESDPNWTALHAACNGPDFASIRTLLQDQHNASKCATTSSKLGYPLHCLAFICQFVN